MLHVEARDEKGGAKSGCPRQLPASQATDDDNHFRRAYGRHRVLLVASGLAALIFIESAKVRLPGPLDTLLPPWQSCKRTPAGHTCAASSRDFPPSVATGRVGSWRDAIGKRRGACACPAGRSTATKNRHPVRHGNNVSGTCDCSSTTPRSPVASQDPDYRSILRSREPPIECTFFPAPSTGCNPQGSSLQLCNGCQVASDQSSGIHSTWYFRRTVMYAGERKWRMKKPSRAGWRPMTLANRQPAKSSCGIRIEDYLLHVQPQIWFQSSAELLPATLQFQNRSVVWRNNTPGNDREN